MTTRSALTNNQIQFLKLAYKEFPDCLGILTRKQVLHICETNKIPQPQWLYKPEYSNGWGSYNLPELPKGSTEPKQTNTIIPSLKEEESDEEISQRIEDTYASMEDLIIAVANNTVNSLIISGGAGLGKSYTVNKVLTELGVDFVSHSGNLRGTHLFRLLWENRLPGQVIVIDDADEILHEIMPMNLLKNSLELKPSRRVGWGSERTLRDTEEDKIPRYFDYQGSIIFLTNENIHDTIKSGNKLSVHLAALESRSLVLDLNIKTKKEYMIKIKQTVKAGMLKNQGISDEMSDEILQFIEDNLDRMRELSLRAVEKISRLTKANPLNWKRLATAVCVIH